MTTNRFSQCRCASAPYLKKRWKSVIGSHGEGAVAFSAVSVPQYWGQKKDVAVVGWGEKKRGRKCRWPKKDERPRGEGTAGPSLPNRRGRREAHQAKHESAENRGKREQKKQTGWTPDYFLCVLPMAIRATIVCSPGSCHTLACRTRCEKEKKREKEIWQDCPRHANPSPFFPSFFSCCSRESSHLGVSRDVQNIQDFQMSCFTLSPLCVAHKVETRIPF